MQRKRYNTNLDEVQAQAVQRAKAALHPAVMAHREGAGLLRSQGVELDAPGRRTATSGERAGQRYRTAFAGDKEYHVYDDGTKVAFTPGNIAARAAAMATPAPPPARQASDGLGMEQHVDYAAGKSPVGRQTGGVEAPQQFGFHESQRGENNLPPGLLQRLLAQQNTGQQLMRRRPQQGSEGPPNVRQRVLQQMQQKFAVDNRRRRRVA